MSRVPDSDPTKHIWDKLLQKPSSRKWTAEERAEAARRGRAQWAARQEQGSLGECLVCGGPLFTEKSARDGVGPDCLKHGLETGTIKIEKGKYVLRRRRK